MTLTVTFGSVDDFGDAACGNYSGNPQYGGFPWSSHTNTITKTIIKTTNSDVSFEGIENKMWKFAQGLSSSTTIDLSFLSEENIGHLSNDLNNNNVYDYIENLILPVGVNLNNDISSHYNLFAQNGFTLIATFNKGISDVDWVCVKGVCTTLKLPGDISSILDLGSITDFTTIDLSDATISANIKINEDVVTLVKVASENAKTYIKKKDGTTAFDDNKIEVPFSPSQEVIGGNIRSQLTNYLASYTSNSAADFTSLTVVGTLTTDDVDYLHSLTGLTTLDLTGANFGTGVTKASIAAAVPNTTTVLYAPAYTISDCTVTIDMGKAMGDNLATILAQAKTDLGSTNICTLIVTGPVSNNDLIALGGANMTGATRIDLSGATLASGASIENIALPTSLTSLAMPMGETISDAMKSRFASASNLLYVYYPSSDCTATGPNQTDSYDETKNTIADYAWVNKPGGLAQAFINETQLRNSFYIKIASSVALNETDVNFAALNENKPTNYLFLDFSESNLSPEMATNYRVTDDPYSLIGYRIILPNNWALDQMAVFAGMQPIERGSLAAVYSYQGTKLNILEIVDGSYSETALKNPRIVREGTTAIEVLGELIYNGGDSYTQHGDLGANLIAALNQADDAPNDNSVNHIKTITINIGNAIQLINRDLVFANANIEYLTIAGIKDRYNPTTGPTLTVTGCTSLKTLDVSGSALRSLDVHGRTSLTSVNMNGTVNTGVTNLSGCSNLGTDGFVTNGDTQFTGDLNLSGTGLSKFSTPAKVTGDIYLDSTPLTSVELNRVAFQNTDSKIYLRKATSGDDANVLTGTLGEKSIAVAEGFAYSTRIVPYTEANKAAIEVKGYVAPPYVYSNTDMHLHTANQNSDGDNYIYWYQDLTSGYGENKVLTLTLDNAGTLATLLGAGNANYSSETELVKVKIIGPLDSSDMDALNLLNTQILDLSEATVESTTITGMINANVKFLILPSSMMSQESFYNHNIDKFVFDYPALAGFTGLYSAISLSDYDPNDAFDFVAYNKVAGTLQPAVIAAGRGTINGSQMIRDGRTAYYPTMFGNSDHSATIAGNINAYDLSYNTKLDANGHLKFNKRYANESLDADDRTNEGTEANIQGAFSGSNGPQTLNLKDVRIAGVEYINDIKISSLTSTNFLKYLIIPQNETVKETPSYFITHNNVKEICIPSNIEVIRTHFAPSVDHIWTNAASGDITGTKYDNGVIESATTTGSGESQVVTQSDPEYGYTNFTFSGQYPVGTYTLSSNLKMIESHAFANTQPHINDVYVLAKTAPECHVDAFCTAMYVGNGGYSPTIIGGVITRDSYVNGNNWIAMLHYPRECATPQVQRYTDPTRAYTTASNETDGKGGVLYYPNHGEFLAAYAQGTTGYLWNAWKREYAYGMLQDSYSVGNDGWTQTHQANANDHFLSNPDLDTDPENTKWTCTSFYDVTAGGALSQPTGLVRYNNVKYLSGTLYDGGSTGTQLYPAANTENTVSFNVNTNGTENDTSDDTKVTSRDFRGWHQFVLNAFAANTDVPVQPVRSYITDTDWWTICLPYDLTYDEMILFYGDKEKDIVPQLHLLSNVVRNEETHTITLNFSSNIMENKAEKDENGVWNVTEGTKPAATDVVLHKGVPYLIKPTFTLTNRQFDVYDGGLDLTEYTALSEGRIQVSSDEYPGLYEKVKAATEINGAEFRQLQEQNIYTVPALLPKNVTTSENKTNVAPTEVEVNGVSYYRSADYDYTFVGSLAKAIIPPYSYYLGVKGGKACFIYADYLKDGIKEATKYKFQNTMRWNNNSCVICPNMLRANENLAETSRQYYNLGKGSHDGKITLAAGKEAAQWKIYGSNVTATLTDDVYHAANMDQSNSAMAMMFGMDIESENEATTIIRVDGVEITMPSPVYNLNGQYVGNSLEGLSQGVYIQNGKKIVVK